MKPQRDTFNFRFLKSAAIPIIFPPTRALRILKMDSNHQQTDQADSIALLLFSESAQVQSLCMTSIKLWPRHTLMTLQCLIIEKHSHRLFWYNIGADPEKSLITKFTTLTVKLTLCFEGQWESALGTVGLIVQGRQAWHQHVIIIHLAARMVSTP